MPDSPASLPSLGLLGGLGTYVPASADTPAPLPHLGLLSGLGAGGATYRLTAESGSYAITGQDAGLVPVRILTAEQGTITISGQVVALSGSLAKAGHPASLPHLGLLLGPSGGFTLTCDPGIYTVVGSEALIDYEHDADQGSYTIAGQDAGLLVSYVLPAEAGTYSITGFDVGSSISGSALTLTADTGIYTITGNDATLAAGYVMSAEHGFYSLAGQAADFFFGLAPPNHYVLDAELGDYRIDGFDTPGQLEERISRFAGGFRGFKRPIFLKVLDDEEETTPEELPKVVKRLAKKAAVEAMAEGETSPPQITIEGDLSREQKRAIRSAFRTEFNRDEEVIAARVKELEEQEEEDALLWLI